jgi:hypothetical protein
MGMTNIHSFRCTDERYRAAQRKAKRERVSLSVVIDDLLARWLAEETPRKGR